LQRFKEVTLAPFSREQIDHFVANWYRRLSEHHRLSATESRRRQESLQQALRRRDLQGLAERPLLLTVMTTLHSFTGKLPEDRAELYQDAVDLLLQRWETRIGGERSLLETLNLPGLKLSDLLAGLYEVAFRAHQQQTAGPSNEDASIDSASAESADIDEARLRQWLAPYLGDSFDKAELFVRYIWERAGLLYRHKSNAFTFLHRSFQEYLAACHLTYQDDYPGEAASLVQADYERWREVFVLAAGHAARTQRLSQAIASVNALCPAAVEECEEPATAPPWRLAHLAGQALLEIGLLGVQRRPEGKALLKRTQQWLATAIGQEAVLPASERVQIGRSLGRLGDPRTPLSDPRQIEFIHIPAGAFTLGSSGQAPEYYDEPPAYRHSLAYDYWMARYPITQAHYAAFVADGGYRQAGFWGEAVQDGFWRAGEVRRRYWNNKRNEVVDEWMQAPADYGEPYSLPNHPLVGVNWYEALAFTRWLTEQLAAAGKLPAGTGVQLPSEAEWEKAARGATTWAYPYGEQTDPNRSNYRGTGIGATSAPGCFPGGRSPYGVEELSGNVWEWTRSLWGSEIEKPDFGYPYDASDGRENLAAGASAFRVLRGGSYFDSAAGVRCALRGGNYPDNWDDNIGFRVALSPSPSDL
jgi:formylglycine-generating enzyme required for sulfatase activity